MEPIVVSGNESERAGSWSFLRVAWGYSEPWERIFILSIYAFFPLALFLEFYVVWSVIHQGWPVLTVWAVLLAQVTFIFFLPVFLSSLQTPKTLREALRRGWASNMKGFYGELSRYIETHGKGGHLQGDIAWGLALLAVYYFAVAASLLFARATYPVLGNWTLAALAAWDLPLALGALLAFGRRKNRQWEEAERKGYPLLQLRSSRGRPVPPPERTDAAQPQDGSLLLRPGYSRVWAWGMFILSMIALLGFVLAILLSSSQGVGPVKWYLLSGTMAVISLVAVAYLSRAVRSGQDQTLEVDAKGVRLYRGRRVARDIPWGEIAKIRCGLHDIFTGKYTSRVGYGLYIQGLTLSKRIKVDDVNYRAPREDLEKIATTICRTARARGIPILAYR